MGSGNGGQYRANWGLQGDGAVSVGGAVSTMQNELDAINREVNSLIATWDSEAQQAYLARQQTWNGAGDNIRGALVSFQGGLNNSADLSSGAEKTNVGVVQG